VKDVTAYKLGGPFFMGIGAGTWFLPYPNVAVSFALKLLIPLPVFAPTLAPEAGLSFAF
jgi:hypothetical protein